MKTNGHTWGNTFRDIVDDELARAGQEGKCITDQEADIRAADRILEGFRTLGEAEEHANLNLVFCDVFGYPIVPLAVRRAIQIKQVQGSTEIVYIIREM